MLNQSAVDALYSATYLEDYLDSVESLPDDLQRQISRLKEMDLVIQSCFTEVSGKMRRLTDLMRNSDEDQLEISRLQGRIQALLIKCQELGDEKIHVGQVIQELIENKNRQLELDRKNLESVYLSSLSSDQKDNLGRGNERKRARRIRQETFIPSIIGPATLVPTSYNSDGRSTQPIVPESITEPPPKATSSHRRAHQNQEPKETSQGNPVGTTTAPPSQSTISGGGVKEQKESTATIPSGSTPKKSEKRSVAVEPPQQVQMKRTRSRRSSSTRATTNPIPIPVDPDEPTYCLCDQVSYGEMIGCDNDLCPIEWFHFSCVSLTTKPKGKWFCPKCRGDRPNQMKPKSIFLRELETYNKEKEEKQ